MKHYSLKSILVIAAFFIGVSINSSCGESPIDDNLSSMYNSIRMLQNEVSNLKQEIKRLDSEIASLKASSGGSQGDTASGEKYIDGLYFNRNGMVSSKIKKISQDNGNSKYIYDNRGRLIEIESNSYLSNGQTSKQSIVYEYSGRTVLYKFTSISDTYTSTSQTTYEYY